MSKSTPVHTSPRQREIIEQFLQGHDMHEAADILGMSINTMKTHIKTIYRKYAIHDRAQLVLAVLKERGIYG